MVEPRPERHREIRLAARPEGVPKLTDMELVEAPVPALADGQVLVRNVYMSLDPATRGRMNGSRDSYVPGFGIGQVLETRAIGRVVESRHAGFRPGDLVRNTQGWREYYVGSGGELRGIDLPEGVPFSSFLGAMGMTGLTAWVGLIDLGRAKAGETVFVSVAAGGVGNLVCQMAKALGCRVVGSAGSPEKLRFLTEEVG